MAMSARGTRTRLSGVRATVECPGGDSGFKINSTSGNPQFGSNAGTGGVPLESDGAGTSSSVAYRKLLVLQETLSCDGPWWDIGASPGLLETLAGESTVNPQHSGADERQSHPFTDEWDWLELLPSSPMVFDGFIDDAIPVTMKTQRYHVAPSLTEPEPDVELPEPLSPRICLTTFDVDSEAKESATKVTEQSEINLRGLFGVVPAATDLRVINDRNNNFIVKSTEHLGDTPGSEKEEAQEGPRKIERCAENATPKLLLATISTDVVPDWENSFAEVDLSCFEFQLQPYSASTSRPGYYKQGSSQSSKSLCKSHNKRARVGVKRSSASQADAVDAVPASKRRKISVGPKPPFVSGSGLNKAPNAVSNHKKKRAPKTGKGTKGSPAGIVKKAKFKAPGLLMSDFSEGKERFPVELVNEHEEAPLPKLKYIRSTQNCYRDDGRKRHPKLLVSCDCTGPCGADCPCVRKSTDWFSKGWVKKPTCYDRNGLIHPKFVTNPLAPNHSIYECGDHCGCSQDCGNRVVQQGLKNNFQIFRTKNMGWGLRPLDKVRQGGFICEYTGVVKKHSGLKSCNDYIFALESEVMPSSSFLIDAGTSGNFGRFINHSCEPNAVVLSVMTHQDYRFPVYAIFALRDVERLEEHFVDYGEYYWVQEFQMYRKFCFCRSRNCITLDIINRNLDEVMKSIKGPARTRRPARKGSQKKAEAAHVDPGAGSSAGS